MLFKEQEKVKKKPKAIYLQIRVKEDEKQALKEKDVIFHQGIREPDCF